MDSYHKVAAPRHISSTQLTISSINCTIYGLSELPDNTSSTACLWLLHPRLQTAATMARFAAEAISAWNARRPSGSTKGLIAVSFDQRNHGSRLTDPLRNEAWRQGNPNHAPDMFATYRGTADDVSTLIDALPRHLPSSSSSSSSSSSAAVVPPPSQHLVLGVSLGAHAAWLNLLHEPRISAAVIIIGCPDFSRLMAHRASKSKLADWNRTDPAGAGFFGSASFPDDLIDLVDSFDPAGVFLPTGAKAQSMPPSGAAATPSPAALEPVVRRSATVRLKRRLGGKAVLNLSGAKDKLVPYGSSEPFLRYLKAAVGGWWKDGMYVEDVVVAGAGHETTPDMVVRSVDFICHVLDGSIQTRTGQQSKM
jgi:pimeloyl-ACP methyl ester carboxylesterase